ncbi:MAG: BNR-4 repeat-containing protein [Candidatus Lokiarchaeota archaeon]|nr:BNR-4 repeat-containing protein [Candidatus Lokiarchaeota archaeon]
MPKKNIKMVVPIHVTKDDGYRGIWYSNQPTGDEYAFKYSGGLGTYPSNHAPFAWHAREVRKTFFCYGASAKGSNRLLHAVSYYDHEKNGVPRPTILLDKQTSDAHDNPVLALDPGGHVLVFSSSHGTARPSYVHRSTEPYSIDGFERVLTTNFSYPECWWIDGHGFVLLFTRYVKGRRFLHWSTSVAGKSCGFKWQRPRRMASVERGHYQVGWSDGRRVGTAFNYHPEEGGLNARTNLYYLETADFGETWLTAGGERVDLPLGRVQNAALVRDYASERLLVYLVDMDFDTRGHPVVLYVTSKGFGPGPANDPRTWTVARWTGRDWTFSGTITSTSNYDVGALHVLGDGTWLLVGPTDPGPQPYNPGGEMVAWESRDGGKTWNRKRTLTSGSEYNHTYARKPVHADPAFMAFWADGDARKPSPSRLYFYDLSRDAVRQLPAEMEGDFHTFDRP